MEPKGLTTEQRVDIRTGVQRLGFHRESFTADEGAEDPMRWGAYEEPWNGPGGTSITIRWTPKVRMEGSV